MLPATELWPETSSFPLPKGAVSGRLGKSLDRSRRSRTGKQGCSRPRSCGGNFQFSSPEGSGIRQVGEIAGQRQAVLSGVEDRKAGMLPATELWPETSSFPLPKGAVSGRLGKSLDRGRQSSTESRTGKQGCSRPRSCGRKLPVFLSRRERYQQAGSWGNRPRSWTEGSRQSSTDSRTGKQGCSRPRILNYRADIRIAFSFSTFSSQVSHSMPLEEGCFPSSYSSSHAETASARDSGSRPLK